VVSTISRGPITSRLLTELLEEAFPVGDNANPEEPYGWSGEPNEASTTFTPWMILTPLTGQPQKLPGSLGDGGTAWSLPYSVFYAGLSRKQAEALADRLRSKLCNIERESVTTSTGNWRIQKVSCSTLGASVKIGSAYPDYYTQTDTFDVWITKER
jgi:hypothetical protein